MSGQMQLGQKEDRTGQHCLFIGDTDSQDSHEFK